MCYSKALGKPVARQSRAGCTPSYISSNKHLMLYLTLKTLLQACAVTEASVWVKRGSNLC